MNQSNSQQLRSPGFTIAEMACSHDGREELAEAIIDGAGSAGADAIQFQMWVLSDMVVAHHPSYEQLRQLELAPETWRRLARFSRDRYPKMQLIACVSEQSSIELAESLDVDAYKTHAGDLSNHELLRAIAETGKRIDLCVGASTQAEIQSALDAIRAQREPEIWLMYGYQTFPTPTSAIHLRYMETLRSRFGLPVGYQDHSDAESDAAFYLPAAAAGAGISIQEKHITHDRSMHGADHQSALNPDEFAQFISMIREIHTALGSAAERDFSPEEAKYRKYSKKSLVAARSLPTGHRLDWEDLVAMRASEIGIPPDRKAELVGRTLNMDAAAQQLVTLEMLS